MSSMVPFTTLFAALLSRKSDLDIGVLNLRFSLTEYCLFDKSFTLNHFLVTNFNKVEK